MTPHAPPPPPQPVCLHSPLDDVVSYNCPMAAFPYLLPTLPKLPSQCNLNESQCLTKYSGCSDNNDELGDLVSLSNNKETQPVWPHRLHMTWWSNFHAACATISICHIKVRHTLWLAAHAISSNYGNFHSDRECWLTPIAAPVIWYCLWYCWCQLAGSLTSQLYTYSSQIT